MTEMPNLIGGALCLDFVNTVDPRHASGRREYLDSYPALVAWGGHTGVIDAAVKGIETVDSCLGDVVDAVHSAGGVCFITADHGNADHMLEDDGSPNTAHSRNPVPCIVTLAGAELRSGGILADVAPTVLELLGIEQPAAMTGDSLLERAKAIQKQLDRTGR